jgi:cytochrome c peroxidase
MPARRPYRHHLTWVCQLAFFVSAMATAVGVTAHGDQHDTDAAPIILAPGYSELSFDAPLAGTYQLPILGHAGNGAVLASDGSPLNLADLIGEKPVLLSFVYTTCDDVNGCPLATYVFSKVAKRIEADAALTGRVRLLSLSFDPQHDTPTVMQNYGRSFRSADTDWRFLTSEGENALQPILERYNQTVAREYDENGDASSTYSHILRVYLIDTERNIRNIYSVSFLHADTIINDLKTIMREPAQPSALKVASQQSKLHGAGDHKHGYEHHGYETQSDYLPNRRGTSQDLLSLLNPPPLGLPAMQIPADNPPTSSKVALGRKIFFDRRLSLNRTISCAMCHVPEQGFTHNELATAVGVEGRTVRRNSPTIYNVGYLRKLFHDARDDRLEHQIWQPLLATNEMANPSVSAVVNKLRSLSDYNGLFEQAFAGEAPSLTNIGYAIASYERTLVSGNSAFDQWHFGSNGSAVDDTVRRGFEVFSNKGRCSSCHLINNEHALFTDHQVHNTGIGFQRSMQAPASKPQRVLLAPGIFIDVDPNAVAESSERQPGDLGFYEITQDPIDRWKYRTPTLRNVDLTGPYMHDGSLSTLESVVEFYDRGGIKNEGLDPLIHPLMLTEREKSDLVSFLKSLTGDNIDQILSDAFAAPVGNIEHRSGEQ